MAEWAAQDVDRAIAIMDDIAAKSGGWDSLAMITFVASLSANMTNLTDAAAVLDYLLAHAPGGWNSEAVITFVGNIPMTLFTDLNDLANAAGWIAAQSGGWNTAATVSFLKNVAANWEFESIDQILASIGWVKEQAGSWTADATISFIAALMDRHGTPLSDMPYWLAEMGLDDVEIPDVMAALILQAEGGGVPIDDIDDYLTSIGIVGEDLSRTIKINMIYDMVSTGALDLAEVAEYVYNQSFAAWLMDAGTSEALAILREMEGIGLMWDVRSASSLGHEVNVAGGYESDPQAWTDLWDKHGRPSYWAEGGIVNSPTLGWIGEAGYPEAIIPMMDGTSIPVKWLNGGSTGSEGTANRPLNIVVQVGNEQFDAHITRVADNVRVKAERRPIGPRRI